MSSNLRNAFVLSLTLLIPAAHATERQPVPNDTAQKEAATLIQEVFGEDIADAKTADQKLALNRHLVEEASRSDMSPADRYAMLKAALDVAPDVHVAMSVIDTMANHFQIDVLKAKAFTTRRMAKSATSPSQRKAIVESAIKLMDTYAERDNFPAALALLDIALDAAARSGDVELTRSIRIKMASLKSLQTKYADVKVALAKLEADPTDAKSNSIVGKFKCFEKGEWEIGLPMLAIGNDEELGKWAAYEIGRPMTGKEHATLADGWWELSEAYSGQRREQLQLHANHWYRQALPKLIGLDRKKVEMRLAVTETPKEPEPVRIRKSTTTKLREQYAPDAVKIGDHFYKVFLKDVPWTTAGKVCQQMGGYLTCLETAEEMSTVASLKGIRPVWVGGIRDKSGQFFWINGKPITHNIRNQSTNYRHVAFASAAYLNLRPDSGRARYNYRRIYGFICEWNE